MATVGALFIMILRPIWAQPGVALSIKSKGDTVEFSIALKNAKWLDEFIVSDKNSKETLWAIRLSYYPDTVVQYGQVPPPLRSISAVQTVPATGLPPVRLPIGKEILVQVGYMYDELFDESGSQELFTFVIEPTGHINCWKVK